MSAARASRQKPLRPITARTRLIEEPLSDDPQKRSLQLSLAPSQATLKQTYREDKQMAREALAERRGLSKHSMRIAPPSGNTVPATPTPPTRPRATTVESGSPSPRRLMIRKRSGELPTSPLSARAAESDRFDRGIRRMNSMVNSYNELKDNVEELTSARDLKTCMRRSQSVETGLYKMLQASKMEEDDEILRRSKLSKEDLSVTIALDKTPSRKPTMVRSRTMSNLRLGAGKNLVNNPWNKPAGDAVSPRIYNQERAKQFSQRLRGHGSLSIPRDTVMSPGTRDIIRDNAKHNAAETAGGFDRSLPHFCVCVIKIYTDEEMLEREEARISSLRMRMDARKARRRRYAERKASSSPEDDGIAIVTHHEDGTIDAVRENVDTADMTISISESDTEDMEAIEKLSIPHKKNERKRETWFVVTSPDRLESKRDEAKAQLAAYQRKIDANIRYYGDSSSLKGCFADLLDMTDTTRHDDPHISHALSYVEEIEKESEKAHKELEKIQEDKNAEAKREAAAAKAREAQIERLRGADKSGVRAHTRSSLVRMKSTMTIFRADGFDELDDEDDDATPGRPLRTTRRRAKSVKWNSREDIRHFGKDTGGVPEKPVPFGVSMARDSFEPKLRAVNGADRHAARMSKSPSMPSMSKKSNK